jgi:V8-like Glu-specific endopeptidase
LQINIEMKKEKLRHLKNILFVLFTFLILFISTISYGEENGALTSFVDCLEPNLQIPLAPDETGDESQCGATIDWQDVELYDGTLGPSIEFVLDHESPVGQIVWNNNLSTIYNDPGNVNGVRWCSGTLITDNLFLTAGHCFDVQENDGWGWDFPVDNQTGDTITSAQAARNMHVSFNYQLDATGVLKNEIQVAITALTEYRLGGMDYAIVQLAGNPGQTFGVARVSDDVPSLNDLLTIIQHPDGLLKVVEAGNYDGVETSGIWVGDMRYTDLDTRPGSSGSGILNDDGYLIGVHTSGGCGNVNANHGLLIDDIAPNSPIIKNLCQIMQLQYSDTLSSPVLFTYQGSDDTKYDNGVRIADLNDDGLPDLIQSHRGRMGGTDWVTTQRAWLNTGSGWNRNDAWAAGLPLFMYAGSRSGKETGVRLTDINDDGRVDVLQSYRGGYGSDTWQTKKGVWINTP